MTHVTKSARRLKPQSVSKSPKGSGTARIYGEIRERILNLELAPGTYLDEAALERLLDVSRTPVREALIRLASEGLVQHEPNRGATVTPIGLESMRQFFEALDLTDRAVTRWAASRRTDDQLATIVHACRIFENLVPRGDQAELLSANNDFHLVIAKASDNRFLDASYKRLVAEGVRLAWVTLAYSFADGITPRKHLDRIVAEHYAIADAIGRRDPDLAEELARKHALLFRSRVDTFFAHNLACDVSIEHIRCNADGPTH